jgi:hypothetical protein
MEFEMSEITHDYRYECDGSFIIEERRGFRVTVRTSFASDNPVELTQKIQDFLSKYNSTYCHSLDFVIREEKP